MSIFNIAMTLRKQSTAILFDTRTSLVLNKVRRISIEQSSYVSTYNNIAKLGLVKYDLLLVDAIDMVMHKLEAVIDK